MQVVLHRFHMLWWADEPIWDPCPIALPHVPGHGQAIISEAAHFTIQCGSGDLIKTHDLQELLQELYTVLSSVALVSSSRHTRSKSYVFETCTPYYPVQHWCAHQDTRPSRAASEKGGDGRKTKLSHAHVGWMAYLKYKDCASAHSDHIFRNRSQLLMPAITTTTDH